MLQCNLLFCSAAWCFLAFRMPNDSHALCERICPLDICIPKQPQLARPRAIVDLIKTAETCSIAQQTQEKLPEVKQCERCGYITSQAVCKACVLLEGLNSGKPRLGVSRKGQNLVAGTQATPRRRPAVLQYEAQL